MQRNVDITSLPRASCKHVNITSKIILPAKFDGYIALVCV